MLKMNLPRILFVLVLICVSVITFAQTRVVHGIVTDQNSQPLNDATITVKDSKITVTTDAKGTFSIRTPENNNILVVTYVGTPSKEVNISGKNNIIIILDLLGNTLNEVVVIGYGAVKRADISSAVASVNTKDLKDLPVAGIDQALQGKVAGLTVMNHSGQPGGGVTLRVRGITTINDNDPLIIIDGVAFPGNSVESEGFEGFGGFKGQANNSFLANINPNDIESIDVLQDASAQAIYGSQAANGVILITTKKGKPGEGKIGYKTYFGLSEIYKKLDLMNLREFAKYQNEVAPLVSGMPYPEFADPSILGTGTDWQEAIFRKAKVQNHQLSFSGGKDKTNYYVSGAYFDQDGILIGSDFKRYSTRFNLESQLKNWVKIGVQNNISRSVQKASLADAYQGTVWYAAIQSPFIPIKKLDGTWGGGEPVAGFPYAQDNPVARSQYRGSKTTITNIFGSVNADVSLLKHLVLKNELAYSLSMNNFMVYQRKGIIGNNSFQSQLTDKRSNGYYYSLKNYMNYNSGFNNHNINAMLGHEVQYYYNETIRGKKMELQNDILDLNAGSNDPTSGIQLSGGKNDRSIESYFARVMYNYDSRYAFSATVRADKSSKILNWGYFPGVSAAWTLSKEKFMQPLKPFVTNFKLRLAYGAVGNQNMPWQSPPIPYKSVIGFWTGPVGFGTSSYLVNVSNRDLKWESVLTQNIGIDASFLNNKVTLTIDAYKKSTKDMLLIATGPRYYGIGDRWDDLISPTVNIGKMSNKGVDVTLNTTNIKNKNFTWKTNFIFSKFNNKLINLAFDQSGLKGEYNQQLITYTQPGYPVSSFYGLKTDGIFRTQEDLNKSLPQFGYAVDSAHTWLGDIRFKDISGPNGQPDGVIDDKDLTYLGSPLPKFTYGFTNNFSYKNFELSVFLQGSYGSKIFNYMRRTLEMMSNAYYNQSRTVLDRYTYTNTNGSLPRFSVSNANNTYISDRYIEDGSYLRIQNINLGYNLNKNWFKKLKLNSARIYASVQNLYTFTKYTGYDPELGTYNNNMRLMNVDMGHYPVPRAYTVGLDIEF